MAGWPPHLLAPLLPGSRAADTPLHFHRGPGIQLNEHWEEEYHEARRQQLEREAAATLVGFEESRGGCAWLHPPDYHMHWMEPVQSFREDRANPVVFYGVTGEEFDLVADQVCEDTDGARRLVRLQRVDNPQADRTFRRQQREARAVASPLGRLEGRYHGTGRRNPVCVAGSLQGLDPRMARAARTPDEAPLIAGRGVYTTGDTACAASYGHTRGNRTSICVLQQLSGRVLETEYPDADAAWHSRRSCPRWPGEPRADCLRISSEGRHFADVTYERGRTHIDYIAHMVDSPTRSGVRRGTQHWASPVRCQHDVQRVLPFSPRAPPPHLGSPRVSPLRAPPPLPPPPPPPPPPPHLGVVWPAPFGTGSGAAG
eukprot:TRINITY_DN27166_c0_g3_i1.p1 TRINITY_DN27166_c0_g3~~TRINITY_DN27166_c0_g3_i1.p1  ORF type:complete len:371 (+),score=39.72 TRINITY_DN27166_c0_g3_i1:174-1286(+)